MDLDSLLKDFRLFVTIYGRDLKSPSFRSLVLQSMDTSIDDSEKKALLSLVRDALCAEYGAKKMVLGSGHGLDMNEGWARRLCRDISTRLAAG